MYILELMREIFILASGVSKRKFEKPKTWLTVMMKTFLRMRRCKSKEVSIHTRRCADGEKFLTDSTNYYMLLCVSHSNEICLE